MGVSSFPPVSGGGGASKERRIDYFSATGTWTAPTGVSYAIFTLVSGGGGGGGTGASGSAGGDSSFNAISLLGGTPGTKAQGGLVAVGASAGVNTGLGGAARGVDTSSTSSATATNGLSSQKIIRGTAVVEATGYAVVVGAGGSGGENAGSGGSGYVTVEYLVEA